MKNLVVRAATLALLFLSPQIASAAEDEDGDGYIGYRLDKRGDPESVNYETANTGGVQLAEEPDVYLNANVSVGFIGVEVNNLTAKVNLDANVLKLLHFSAGVDASINRVKLTIENVSAKVELEARLGNVVAMVDDVLNSIDLNPILATLGQNVNKIVNSTTDLLDGVVGGDNASGTGAGAGSAAAGAGDGAGGNANVNAKREMSYNLKHNVLFSVNDYTGQAHKNRILDQDGSIYDEYLDNDGNEESRTVVGSYETLFQFTGHNRTIEKDGQVVEFELEYEYRPFPGVEAFSWIFVDTTGKVTRTQVISEAHGGGTSTISNDSD
ncbi:hypothetical protein QBC35DRAFT_440804 [Podospora australis]|uniref:Uncharacterized protein n=1 Tax=Podospora australis TaxID=1536484 RepID=A0AAN7AF00_9PEZI|nr:hypothetical protein QBC35DRAFT_440804 [Podospora australis]